MSTGRATCPHCGQSVDSDAQVCPRCETELIRLCRCGSTRSLLEPRCPACGRRVRGRVQETRVFWRLKYVALALGILLVPGLISLRYVFWDPVKVRRQEFDRAWADYREGRIDQSRIRFGEYLEDHPGDARARYMYALALLRLDREEEAVAEARRALETDPDHPEANLLVADAAYRNGGYEEALTLAHRALAARPGYPAAHLLVGKILTRPGYYDPVEAEQHLERSLAGGEDSAEALLLLGELALSSEEVGSGSIRAERARSRLEAAHREAQKLLEEETGDKSRIWNFLARVSFALDDLLTAEREARKSLVGDSGNAGFRVLLGKIVWRRNQAEGLRILTEALSGDAEAPDFAETARFLRDEGREDLAARFVADGRNRFPHDPGLLLWDVRRKIDEGGYEVAERDLRAALVEKPGAPRLIYALANCLFAQAGRAKEAADLLREHMSAEAGGYRLSLRLADYLLDTPEGSPRFAANTLEAEKLLSAGDAARTSSHAVYRDYLRGKLLLVRKRYPEAVGALSEAAEKMRGNAAPHLLLARAHAALGEPGLEGMEYTLALEALGPRADLLLARGGARLREGAAELALKDFEEAKSLGADGPEAALLMARAYLAQRPPRAEEAVSVLEAAIAAPGADASLGIELGRARLAAGDLEGARKTLDAAAEEARNEEEALEVALALADLEDRVAKRLLSQKGMEVMVAFLGRHPGSIRGHLLLGQRRLDRRDREGAEREARDVLALDAGNLRARRILFDGCFCVDHESEIDRAAARKILDEAAALEPEGADTLYMRGKVCLIEGDPAGALDALRLAKSLAPGDSRIAYFLALALSRSGNRPAGLAELDRALELEPAFVPARRLAAQISFDEGRSSLEEGFAERAIDEVRAGLGIYPEATPLRGLLAEAQFRAGVSGDRQQLVAAREECERLIETLGRSGAEADAESLDAAWLLLGNIAHALEDWRLLLRACDAYCDRHPDDPEAKARRGAALVAAGEAAEAVRFLTGAAKEHGPDEALRDALLRAYVADGRVEDAARLIRTAADAEGWTARSHAMLASMLERLGRAEEACEEYVEALRTDADFLPAAEALLALRIEKGQASRAEAELEDLHERTGRKGDVGYLVAMAHLAGDPTSSKAVALTGEPLREGIRDVRRRAWCLAMHMKALLQAGGRSEAIAAFERYGTAIAEEQVSGGAGQLDGALATLQLLAGIACFEGGETERAERHYRRGLIHDPRNPVLLNNLADLLSGRPGSAEEAVRYANLAVREGPGLPQAWDTLGAARLAQKQPAAAIPAFEKAAEIYRRQLEQEDAPPDRDQIPARLARTLRKQAQARRAQGDAAGANACLAEAKKLESENGDRGN